MRPDWTEHTHFTFLTVAAFIVPAASFISVSFNRTQYFGPDGPWQAGIVRIGPVNTTKWQQVNLYPSFCDHTQAAAYVPTTQACANSASENCLLGDGIPPLKTTNRTFSASFNNPDWVMVYNGSTTVMEVELAGGVNGQAVVGVSSIAETTYPNGAILATEVGLACLGGNPQPLLDDPPLAAWKLGGIQSDSFSLQIGATMFDYPASLVFGGYDRGRLIGPVVQYLAQGPVTILDIVLGVEIGGNPFPVNNGSSVLSTSMTTASSISASLAPQLPYLFLPQDTVDAVVKHLPVTFDISSGYYLWQVNDPSYNRIVNSATYLGFVFPTTSGQAGNLTIKVPFKLLNLTLEAAASGLGSDVPYFPIMHNGYASASNYDDYAFLGRAFLQAAFVGTTWQHNISWLAQAPGPGSTRTGLGSDPVDLEESATTLQAQTGDSLFRDSWKGYWTPLPVDSSAKQSNETEQHSNHGLSGGQIAGAVVGPVVFFLAVAAIAGFLLLRRSEQRSKESKSSNGAVEVFEKSEETSSHEMGELAYTARSEMPAPGQPGELSGLTRPLELSTGA